MKTIVWDVDEVLNNLVIEWLEYWKVLFPDCKITYDQITNYSLKKVLNAPSNEILQSIDDFKFLGFFTDLKPNQKILKWFEEYGKYFHHIALTSCSLRTSHISASWVYENFGRWIRSFHCIPSSREGKEDIIYDINKAEYIKRIEDVDIFIDDCPENCEKVQDLYHGIKIFTPKKPWNTGTGIDIEEILREITKLI
jgi:5'(3')-deoxyribonucleotidase